MELIEKIRNIAPDATIEECDFPTITVAANQYREVAWKLRHNPDLSFDYLICMTGVDWGDSLGVISLLQSTAHEHKVYLKTFTPDREKPELPSVCDLWGTANLNEREVFDFLGIHFINHPDMRRLFLRNDWVGYPLRKDYDANPNINPVRLESEHLTDFAPSYEANEEGEIEEMVEALASQAQADALKAEME